MRIEKNLSGVFQSLNWNKIGRSVALIFVLAVVYFFVARLGLALATLNKSASPVWPATGFAFAIVFLFGPRALFAVAIGAFAANFMNGGSYDSSVLISAGNTLEALVGSFIIRSIFAKENKFGDQTKTIAFLSASVVGSLFSATIGVFSLVATDALSTDLIGPVWFTWWVGDVLGGLVVSPILIQYKDLSLRHESWINALVSLGFTFIASYFVFFLPQGGAFLFVLFPVLLLAVHLFRHSWVIAFPGIIFMASISATLVGAGQFSVGTLNERLVHLQLFLAAYSLTALALSGFGKDKLSKVPAGVLLLCWSLSGILFYSFDKSEKEKTEAHFKSLVYSTEQNIKNLMLSYEDILRGGIGLYSASKSVEYDEWKAFAQTFAISTLHPGMNGVGIVWSVKNNELERFKQDMKAQGLFEFDLKTIPGFLPNPKERFIIKFIEPAENNRAAFGLDIGSEPSRRQAAEISRDTGIGTVTTPIKLVQDKQQTPGFLYFLPIYKNRSNLDSVEARIKSHVGWAYAPIIYKNFFLEVIQKSSDEIEFQAFQGSPKESDSMVFSSIKGSKESPDYEFESRFQIAQKDYLFRWAKSAKFISSHNTIVSWVGFFGALASLLLANLLITSQHVGFRARQMAEKLNKELFDSREEFKQGERRLLYALDGSNDGIWDWNIPKSEMYVSGKISLTHGWPQSFFVKTIDDLGIFAHTADLKSIEQSISRLFKGESETHEVETRYRTISGEWRWVLTRGKVSERNESGKPTRMTGVHIDIHDLKMAQQELENTKHQLFNIANSVPTKVSFWNKNLVCEFANELCANWYGIPSSSVRGKDFSSFVATTEAKDSFSIVEKVLKGEKFGFEGEVIRPRDQSLRFVIVNYLPHNVNGILDGFFLFIQDITELKKAEFQANEERRIAIEAVSIKSQFLANMSHEIRTPLNGVIGMTKLLKRTGLNEKQTEYTEVISRSSDALLNLINDILDFSKAEAGKLELEVVDFSLRKLVEDVMKLMSYAASEKKLKFESQTALDVGDYYKGDSGRLRQVLTNLISNAIKFTASGSVELRIASSNSQISSRITFQVIDTGMGIPEEAMGRMFQAFTQVDASTTRRFGGTGLGLSISKQLVQAMDGEIGVRKNPIKGSIFWFSIELPFGEKVKNPDLMVIAERTNGAQILVVEDNRVNQQIAIEILEAQGYAPHVVGNGIEALDALREAKYDLILMDCQMPEMDGYQATEIIRKSQSLGQASIPIIAMTANALDGDIEKCKAAGMDDYISKPFDESNLVYMIETFLIRGKETHLSKPSKKSKHILVVEDNKVNQSVIGLNLEDLSYTFEIAENGAQAIEFLSGKSFDLVLMDCQMPEMDGYEATRQIRLSKASETSKIPIVALTANALKGDREKCLAAGMDDYLTKPIDVGALAQMLTKWLDRDRKSETKKEFQVKQENNSNVIDIQAIEKLRKLQKPGRPDIVAKLIDLFFESAHENVERIRMAIQKKELNRLSEASHALKSSAANVGAIEFSRLCLKLEEIGNGEESSEKMHELLNDFEKEFVLVLQELEKVKRAA
ncbi:MAG: hypothetical protein B7Y39_07780 [Bdellovibrio sp. 28-41-41]|nr:MAG: hypothetical protein B7Y39_07780 [Bdellovibrio sp. 28-41-41]